MQLYGEEYKSRGLSPVFLDRCSGITETKGGRIVARPAQSQGEQAPTCQGEEVRGEPVLHGAQPYSSCGIWDLNLGAH